MQTAKRILWIDDEVDLFEPHLLFLRQRGYEVDTTTNDLVPALATGFEQNDDWREATITLRDGVVFTDGEELTAQYSDPPPPPLEPPPEPPPKPPPPSVSRPGKWKSEPFATPMI